MSSLGESVRQQWSRDVDLADGELQMKHTAYLSRLSFIDAIVRDLTITEQRQRTLHNLQLVQCNLTKDLDFVASGEFLSLLLV